MKFQRESDIAATPTDPEKFTGGVWQAEILDRIREDGLRGHRFAYAPRGRSRWHTHTGEQAIVVLVGRGLVQREGDHKARLVRPGDWVHIEPGEGHWHGAAPDDVLVHLAITATGDTRWGSVVGDDEYDASIPEQ
ncbi:MAG TPA: cupin domain-containing protein [Nitriliruptorales bacterium]|nr:cupin domain-containing protein [Nitriliruptorales bacterium]